MQSKPTRWKSRRDGYLAALNYMNARRKGEITSLKTSSPKINDASCDGFEFNTAVCLCARPGDGKSLLKEQFIREFFELNPNMNFRVLDFDLEMPALLTAIREFSSHLGKSYKYMCSAEADFEGLSITKEQIQMCHEYARKKLLKDANTKEKLPLDLIEDAPTVSEFVEIVEEYMEAHKIDTGVKDEDGKPILKYTNTVITVDHVRMFRKAPYESGELEMLQNFGKAVVMLKKKYPILFILLNHLVRTVVDAARCEDGKNANYITESDVFGGDALCQSVDILIGFTRPAKRHIRFYGGQRFCIQDDTVVVFHFLKVRNGTPRMSFFKAEFDKMQIVERDTPAMAIKQADKRKSSEEEQGSEMKPLKQNDLFTQTQS